MGEAGSAGAADPANQLKALADDKVEEEVVEVDDDEVEEVEEVEDGEVEEVEEVKDNDEEEVEEVEEVEEEARGGVDRQRAGLGKGKEDGGEIETLWRSCKLRAYAQVPSLCATRALCLPWRHTCPLSRGVFVSASVSTPRGVLVSSLGPTRALLWRLKATSLSEPPLPWRLKASTPLVFLSHPPLIPSHSPAPIPSANRPLPSHPPSVSLSSPLLPSPWRLPLIPSHHRANLSSYSQYTAHLYLIPSAHRPLVSHPQCTLPTCISFPVHTARLYLIPSAHRPRLGVCWGRGGGGSC